MSKVKLTDRYVANVTTEPGKRLEIFDQHLMGAGLMLRVTETGRKTWMVRYRTDDGQQRRLNLGLYPDVGLAEARSRAAEARKKATDGDDPAGARRKRRVEAKAEPFKTFADLAGSYFIACEVGEWKPRKKKKRASTLRNEKWLWARHIKPDLGALAVEDVTPAAIRTVLRKLVATGRQSTSNKVRAQIRQIFNFAISDERVEINPVARTTALHDETPRQRVLTDDEIRQVWAALSGRTDLVRKGKPAGDGRVLIGEPVSLALKLLLVTLVRRAEVSGAARLELDLVNGVWLIPGARTKSGKAHLVPLSPMAVELFKRSIELADASAEPSRFVFPSPRDRNQPITPAALTHALRYVREALELERLTPHDLRRTGATNMASERLGVSPFVIGKVLSHSTELGGAASVTLTTYALYDYVKEKRDALAAWALLLSRIVGGGPVDAPGPSPCEPLAAGIDDNLRRRSDFFVRETLTWAIVRMGPASVPPLLELLESPDLATRLQTVHTLSKIADPASAAALNLAVNDSDGEVARKAIFALGQMGHPDALNTLIAGVGHPDAERRNTLSTALMAFGQAALSPLLEMLGHPEAPRRAHAADILGLLGDPVAAPALTRALMDDAWEVQFAALCALGHIPGADAGRGIAQATRLTDPRLLAVAQRLLASRPDPSDIHQHRPEPRRGKGERTRPKAGRPTGPGHW